MNFMQYIQPLGTLTMRWHSRQCCEKAILSEEHSISLSPLSSQSHFVLLYDKLPSNLYVDQPAINLHLKYCYDVTLLFEVYIILKNAHFKCTFFYDLRMHSSVKRSCLGHK
jgi:hypothetical protein